MPGRKKSKESAATVLERLADDEARAVLGRLLEMQPELRSEAENIAQSVMSSQSVEDIAANVFDALSGIGLDALNGRAGKHSWGYVEPSEAAVELLEEASKEWVSDMERHVELDMIVSAEAVCVGIVAGLYECRDINSDGVLAWAPDFPAEHAGFVVEKFLKLSRYKLKKADREKFIASAISHASEWNEMFDRIAAEFAKA